MWRDNVLPLNRGAKLHWESARREFRLGRLEMGYAAKVPNRGRLQRRAWATWGRFSLSVGW